MRSAGPTIRFVPCPWGERIATATFGHGPLLVCPAWWVGHVEQDWEGPEFRHFFSRLGDVATVVRYDRPGVGLSSAMASEPSLAHEVRVLDEVIRAQGVERVSLLGISCGGPPAIRWAAEHPERVERLVLCGTFACGRTIAAEQLQNALVELVRAHWGAGARALTDVFMPDATPEQREQFTALQRTTTSASTAAQVLALTYQMDVSAELERVRARTFVIHRKHDRAIPFRAGHELALGIPGAELTTLDGRDHVPWLREDAAEVIAHALGGSTLPVEAQRDSELRCRLDVENRRLVRDGEGVELTALEFRLVDYLCRHPKRVVARGELVEQVWRQPHAGSNVVDAVVRTVRKKLGHWAPSLATVVGHGYRFDGWTRGDHRGADG